MRKKQLTGLKRAVSLMTVFTLVLGSAVATDIVYNKDDGTAYADGIFIIGDADSNDLTLPLVTMPTINTDTTVEYNIAGNAWYGVEAGNDYWTLVDTDAKYDSTSFTSAWGSQYSGQTILDYTNGLASEYFSDLKSAIKTKNVNIDTNLYGNYTGTGSLSNAYMYPLSYNDLNKNKILGAKIFTNANRNIWSRTFSGCNSSSNSIYRAWNVYSASGNLNYYSSVAGSNAVAPAFNLDLEKVLIARSAESPQPFGKYKESENVGNVLVVQSDTYNPSFNITTENGHTIDKKTISIVNSQVLTLEYSNAKNGDLISAIVYNENNEMIYYGSLETVQSESGMIELDLSFAEDDNYTIVLFSENITTHIASTPIVMSLQKNEYESFTDAKTGITWKYTVTTDGYSRYVENLHTLNGSISQIIDKDGVLNIPENINGTPVKSIGTGKIETPFIPASVNGYTSINFPSGLKEIKAYAFYGNAASARITIPAQIETIGEYAFWHCDSYTDIIIETSMEDVYAANTLNIKTGAFSEMSALKNVSILPSNEKVLVKKIVLEDKAFSINTSLRKVILSGNIEVGKYAFANATSLDAVSITGPNVTIKSYAFNNCKSIEKLNIPKEVTLEAYAFNSCTGLKELKINAEKIPNWSFADCYNISKVVFGDDVSTVEYAWGGTSKDVLSNAESIETTIDVNSSLTCFQMYNDGTNYYSAFMGWKDAQGSHSSRNVSVKYPEAKNTSVQNGDNGAKGYPAYLIFNPGAASGGETVDMTAYTANGSISVSGNKSSNIESTEPGEAVRNGFDVYYNGKVYSVSANNTDNRKDDTTGKYVFDKSKFEVVPTYTDATTGEKITDFYFFNMTEAQNAVSEWIEKTDTYTYKNVTDVGDTAEHNWSWYVTNINNKSATNFQELLAKQKAEMVQNVFNNKELFLQATANVIDEKATVEKIPTGDSSIMQTLTVIYYPNTDTSVDPDYNSGEPTYYTMTADVKVVEYSEEQEFFDRGFTYASVMKEYNKLDEQTKEFESSVKETIDSINEALGDAGNINVDDYDNVNDAYKAAMEKLQELITGAEEGSQSLADALKAAKEAQEAQAKAEENLKKIEKEYAKLAETYKDLLANSSTDDSGYITETDKDGTGDKTYTVVVGSTIYDCVKTGKTYTDANGTYDIYKYTDENSVSHFIYADKNGVHELTISSGNLNGTGDIVEDITPDNKDNVLEKEPEDVESSQAVVMQRKLLAQIASLSEKLNSLESSLDSMANDLSSWIDGFDQNTFSKLPTEDKMDAIKEAISALNKAYTTVKADYDKLNGAYSDIANANNKLNDTNNKLNDAVNAFEQFTKDQADKESLTTAYNAFNTSYSELNAIYKTLNEQYETIKGVSGTIDNAVTALNKSKTQLDKVATSLTKAYNLIGTEDFGSAYDELESAKDGLTESVKELDKASKELGTALDALQANVTNYQTALSNIRVALGLTASNSVDTKDIEEAIAALQSGLSGVSGDLSQLINKLKDAGLDIDADATENDIAEAVAQLNKKYTDLVTEYNKIIRKIYGANDTVEIPEKDIEEILGQLDAITGDTEAIQKEIQEALSGETVGSDELESLGSLILQIEEMRTNLEEKTSLLQQIMKTLGITDSAQILQSIVSLQNKVTELEKQVANGSGNSNNSANFTAYYQSGYTAGYTAGLKENLKGNNSELASKITELTEKTVALSEQNATLTSKVEALTTQTNGLTSSNATLTKEKEQLSSQIASLNAQVSALNNEKSSLASANDVLNNSIASLNSQVAELNNANSSLQDQITALKQKATNSSGSSVITNTPVKVTGPDSSSSSTSSSEVEKETESKAEKVTIPVEENEEKETEEESSKSNSSVTNVSIPDSPQKPSNSESEASTESDLDDHTTNGNSRGKFVLAAFVTGMAALAGGLGYTFVLKPKFKKAPANDIAEDYIDDEFASEFDTTADESFDTEE